MPQPSPLMPPTRIRIARDYNRGLPRPARWAHLALAALRTALHPLTSPARHPTRHPTRRAWLRPLILGLLGLAIFLPLDGPINRLVNPAHYSAPARPPIRLGGDFRREAEFLQQYGQFTCSVIAIILIITLDRDRARRRAIADWIAAALVALAAINLLKLAIGRPRPKFDDPWAFLGPLGTYAVEPDNPELGLRHAWEFWSGISSDLWSMPSSHTAYAVVMSFALATMYPRLRGFAITMVFIVGLARVLLNSHYPSDVIAGAAIGYIAASAAFRHRWGQRLLARHAGPAETSPQPP